MPGVLATTAFRQRRPRHIGQPERVIQFAVSEPSGVGGDPAAVEFQLQAAVEINPKRNLIRFTRWVFHPRAPASTTTCWNSCQIRPAGTREPTFMREIRVKAILYLLAGKLVLKLPV